jgi:hypothetical protein
MTCFGKTLLAGAVVAGLGVLGATQPASAAIVNYDLQFTTPNGMFAFGSITIETAQLGGNTTCALTGGCGFVGFGAQFIVGPRTFTFDGDEVLGVEVTTAGGVPAGLTGSSQWISSDEDAEDFAGFSFYDTNWTLGGVIDGFEFNVNGTFAIPTNGGGDPDPDPVGVPEPATLLLFGAGLAGAALMRR